MTRRMLVSLCALFLLLSVIAPAQAAPEVAGKPATPGASAAAGGPAADVAATYREKMEQRKEKDAQRITQEDREAAADRAAAEGFDLPEMGAAEMAMPGVAPRYFSHPNYANSPLRLADALVELSGGDGSGATAAATVDPETGAITAIDVVDGGIGYATAPDVVISGAIVTPTTEAAAVATVEGGAVTSIDVTEPGAGYVTPGIRKFVDELPGLNEGAANNLGQFIPVAVPDTTKYPGTDYYEIAVLQWREQMHSDLPPTLVRGYVQLTTPENGVELFNEQRDGSKVSTGYYGVTEPHYLGPLISAQKGRPVRILFRNLLPTGVEGDLFIPTDTTVMGSGPGPDMDHNMMHDPQNPMCGDSPKPLDCYTENRATLHLHGGITPWISDGTPHQWITPANEDTPYPQGVSVENVPDMTEPVDGERDGAQTFYYTNQQSARLMFYHDHSWGITRLNVYAGEAAGYLITDEMEQALIDQGLIPAEQTPLIVQDKTFVPADWQLAMQDETWDSERWGGLGDLWLPHVYSPAQNPGDSSGVNQFGRWMYGPWFWPPTNSIDFGPIPNAYYDTPDNQACIERDDPDEWCEPEMMPGTPYNSMGMEAFSDTPVVNGTAYPTFTVDPEAVRFRILNAANDRFFNLSLYQADPDHPTEVALNPDEVAAALEDPAVVFPTPDESRSPKGPDWIQIGTEGGFLPAPAVIPAQPITWVNDPTVFNAGNVDKHSLLVGPAERADTIVDFSQYAGKTLILYNDAPAAFPARDPRYDYYTGSADLTDTGGVPTIPIGFGPNTRTVMQIKVNAATPAAPYDVAALQGAFKAEALGGTGVFKNSQHPIIVGQAPYNDAYGTAFRRTAPRDGLVRITDFSFTFDTLSGTQMTNFPLESKQIQDEMGEAFEREYGRMSGNLGVETPNAQAGLQNMILYNFTSPPTEVIDTTNLPKGMHAEPISQMDDGTQIWKVTHNGVDTHPMHFHLYDVQVINRVGWDGIIRRPEANELGWKDTVRISPLEDTILALRPIVPEVPFDLPNSIRMLDPSMPEGAFLENTTQQEAAGLPIFAFDPMGEPIDIINHKVNFGWEYVWHCHILSHEEMDMMRPVAVAVVPKTPTGLTATRVGNGPNRRVDLRWTDIAMNETEWLVERATLTTGPWTPLATIQSATGAQKGVPAMFTDPIGNTNQVFFYRVTAKNVVGDTWDYSDPNLNEGAAFPTKTTTSGASNIASFVAFQPPAAPSNLTGAVASQTNNNARITLNWADNADNETGFTLQRATNDTFSAGLNTTSPGANVTSLTTGNLSRNVTYFFRVRAFNAVGESAWSNTFSIRP